MLSRIKTPLLWFQPCTSDGRRRLFFSIEANGARSNDHNRHCHDTLPRLISFSLGRFMQKWTLRIALRDITEIVAVLAFAILIPPLVERFMVTAGLGTTGSSRIVATGLIFISWALLAALLVRINGEGASDVGLSKPSSISRTIIFGIITAAAVFVIVVGLERFGYGINRLGELGAELKGNPALVIERIAMSVLIVGPVEEFIFRGFLFLRLTMLFGGSKVAIALALILQAILFGISHAYQHLYGILLTTFLAVLFGAMYLALRRNLWVIIIGHGVYDAAHAIYLSGVLGNRS
jgi:membrane protease YdiL (CAAX protease family)